MPVYGYRCGRGHHFEVQQRITELPITQCPECGAPVTRVFYPVGIIFKGGGFYKTDSRGAASDGSTPAAETAKTAKTEPKTETKAPVKTEEKKSTKEGAA
jgi:putative FmdB family regulatory protein